MNDRKPAPPIMCVRCHECPAIPESFPFCSERCRLIDLGQWAQEEYRVPAEPVPPGEEQDPTVPRGERRE